MESEAASEVSLFVTAKVKAAQNGMSYQMPGANVAIQGQETPVCPNHPIRDSR
jgi:hypothetical protein